MWKELSVFLLIASVSLIFGCQPASKDKTEAQKKVTVAVAGPFTGSSAAYGEMIHRGAELKAKEINAAGGINGMTLSLVFEDDTGKEKEARNVATRIGTDRQTLAVVGHFNSACSLAGKPIYKQNGIVELSPGSTNVDVCVGSEWSFRNLYRDDFQGQFIARYLQEFLSDYKKIAVFYHNDDYGKGLRDGFTAAAEEIGLQIIADEAYDVDSSDFKAQLTSIKAKNPDLVFISGLYSQAGLIAKQAREAGITAQLFGGDGVDSPGFLEIAGDDANGTYVSTPFTFELGGDDARKMADAFEADYGVQPDTWAALTYDALGMIADAIGSTYDANATLKQNRKAIRDYLAARNTAEKGYNGITGLTYFDENGDCIKPAYVKIVKDGKFMAAPQQLIDEE